ncbi:hypothetical protein [Microbulbifer magnicolonia]|uniref:hypothetical protein n=1 Tax=Microbulbifer magnicolonia TaxID=3109744 RepID=UPI002B40788E|nr:hypothetical protein [Microbulbifer sp. GG15]
MKLLPRKLLLSGAGCALTAVAALTLPACTNTTYTGASTSGYSSSPHYQVGGRYYHCHPGGVCHNVRHPDYYRSGGHYLQRPIHRYHRPTHHYRYRPAPPPPRPRPY